MLGYDKSIFFVQLGVSYYQLLEGDTNGVEGTLLALVFLGMVLEEGTGAQKNRKNNKNKIKGRLQVSKKNIEQGELYDA